MSAGTGIRHSEFNPVHFLQIWLLPDRGVLRRVTISRRSSKSANGCARGSPDGRGGSILIHQDVELYDALLASGEAVTRGLKAGRKTWVQIVRGTVEVKGTAAGAGDGAAVQVETRLAITSQADDSEILVFDLP